jgi:hypothetical protein
MVGNGGLVTDKNLNNNVAEGFNWWLCGAAHYYLCDWFLGFHGMNY